MQYHQAEEEKKIMEITPYESGGGIMYGIVCSRLNLSYAINIISLVIKFLN